LYRFCEYIDFAVSLMHMKKYYYLLFSVLGIGLWASLISPIQAQDIKIDSLEQKLQPESKDTSQVNLLNLLCKAYQDSNPSKALEYGENALALSKEMSYKEGEASALVNIGNAYRFQGDYPKALQYLIEANKKFERVDNIAGRITTLNSIGIIHYLQDDYETALKYYNESLQIAEENNDLQGIASTFNNIGNIYSTQSKDKEALEAFEKALSINQELGNQTFVGSNLTNIGVIYFKQGDYKKTLTYLEKALKAHQEGNNLAGVSATLNFMAAVNLQLNEVKTALKNAQESLQVALKANTKNNIKSAYETLSNIYDKQGEIQKSLETYKLYTAYKDSLFDQEKQKSISFLENSYAFERQQTKIDLLEQEKRTREILNRSLVAGLVFLFIGVILIAGVAFFAYKNYQTKRKQAFVLGKVNKEMQHKNEILLEQKNIIEQKKKNIDSSIQYAKRIQNAVLPVNERIKEAFPNSFIFIQPRDVVSGDFYWFTETDAEPVYSIDPETGVSVLRGFDNEKQVIAAVDSTGHGIPGAFMSLLGSSLLNQIVIEKNITDAAKILNELHRGIRETLKQDQNNNHDGMDLALCILDKGLGIIEFAGAHNPIVYFKNGELNEVRGDPFGIGGYERGRERFFTRREIPIEGISQIYIFSDGYKDQFGGERGKKLLKRRFYDILRKIHKEPISKQKELLEKHLKDWSGAEAQVDDILVIGICL